MTGLTFAPGGALGGRLIDELLGRGPPGAPPVERMGPFRILRELGRGGLGVVYLAERADGAFEQKVALKLIRPGGENARADALLERERRILARLEHPGIARLIDGGSAGGMHWFAMEYVEGERIDRYCRAHALDGPARLSLLLKVCEAVAYAHAHLVAHRDLKPGNILVDARGEPRLLDFGIAAALDEAGQDDPARRAATPGFASPEQYRGEGAGSAADVYQLGLLLETLMHGVAVADRRGLAAVQRRALSDRPEHRYPSAEALAADVRNLLARRPVSACMQERGYRTELFLRRHRTGSLAAFAAGAVFLATVVYFLWSLNTAREWAEREAASAQRVNDFMVGLFESADPGVHLGEKPTADVLLARGRERIEHGLVDDPTLRGDLLTTLGRVYVALHDRESALSLLKEAVALGEADDRIPPEKLALRKQLLGRALSLTHRSHDSRTQLDEALDLISGKPGQVGLETKIRRGLAVADCFEGNIKDGIDRLTAAIDDVRGTWGETAPEFAASLANLGLFLLEAGRIDDAVPPLSEAYERSLASAGPAHPDTNNYASMLAMAFGQAGRFEDAERLARDALERTRQVAGERSPQFSLMLARYGKTAYWRGEFDTAIGHYLDSIRLADDLPVGSDISSATILGWLGDAYMAVDEPSRAEAAYRQMLSRDLDGGRSLGPDIGDGPLRLARALAAQGRCQEAEASLQQARERAAAFSLDYPIHAELRKPLPGCPDLLGDVLASANR